MVSESLSSLFIPSSILFCSVLFCSAMYLFCIYFLSYPLEPGWMIHTRLPFHLILSVFFFVCFFSLRNLIHVTVCLPFSTAPPWLFCCDHDERSVGVLICGIIGQDLCLPLPNHWATSSWTHIASGALPHAPFQNWRGGCQHSSVPLGSVLITLFVYFPALVSDNMKLCFRPELCSSHVAGASQANNV